ncbi:unnamed protein product [Rhizophagus irregularis]|nr:unnamed protein product [Rhizophagus irregularis]
MRETQFQQHIQNLEKQKSEQFEIFSQNLEKALGKLRLDDLHEDNVNNSKKDFILSSDELDEDNVNNPEKDESLNYMKDSTIQKVTIKKELIPPIDKSSFNKDNIRVVVGLDFGTTYSGFSYCHVADSENITTNDQWPENFGNLKTNTAITDYLHEIGKFIKETIELRFQGIDFHKHVLLVLTVPTEYLEKDIDIMRECVHNAGLIAKRCSNKLQFTTESEAAAIYCMQNVLKEHDLLTSGTIFMIVDCGGVRNYWMEGDPIERKLRNGCIDRFHCIAKRGTQVDTNEEFTTFFTPLSPMQAKVCFKIYYTTKDDAKYCDEPGMTLLGKFGVYLADSDESSKSGLLDKLFFAFIFGEMVISFIARNEISGQNYKTYFEVIPSDSL